jgi:hypothetical protein
MHNETKVLIDIQDLIDYVEYREELAQIEIIKDHIKPLDGPKAKRLIAKIQGKDVPSRKKNVPRELVVRNASPEVIQQFLVRRSQ